ncbi:hypothetical protein F9C07_2281384 [Aspergillus flavus]|uniref:Uncharacterized protein n=2 Tax=Aspergillus subgen. Circumdati TaxID=2720871 RepID=A0A7G5JZJ3_ASPFN|nr:uncharacterized protein G4B84_004295 [Aspergillus flavus NRRL3357]KAB8275945.1 hypothetical protein BDV30DRAFT_236191 [Aspergillus minisclerotigenes]QMW41035.1 hypothetical protein G4B11_004359 [Aspergillus flavus]KAF7617534.1 hypothetical protein AFLA_006454 [Aspergillus flavus NRRL3357]QMW28960.1 hypothetical protein G4B84_004295 [Aspergillus flavus NRRL3357]QRD85218.1 hypothetical protein F9C07_2281384 [Aspergillus flavus]
MKATTICSFLLATGTALAMPAKRAEQTITISELFASQTDQNGYVTFKLDDPNYNDVTGANVIWRRPGNPIEGARTSDAAYYVQFPGGVNDISVFILQLQRVNSTEKVSFTLNDNGSGHAPGTKWHCNSTESGTQTVKKCNYDGVISL